MIPVNGKTMVGKGVALNSANADQHVTFCDRAGLACPLDVYRKAGVETQTGLATERILAGQDVAYWDVGTVSLPTTQYVEPDYPSLLSREPGAITYDDLNRAIAAAGTPTVIRPMQPADVVQWWSTASYAEQVEVLRGLEKLGIACGGGVGWTVRPR